MSTTHEPDGDSITHIAPYSHYRVEDGDFPDGIYRVVGVGDERITVIRVGDADDQRINTGELVRLRQEELDKLPEAPNPDGTRPTSETLGHLGRSVYWTGLTFVRTLIANLLPAVSAGVALLLGLHGGNFVPEIVSDILGLSGAIGLAVVGNGRVA